MSNKSPIMEEFLNTIVPHRELYMRNQMCVSCGCYAGWFKDELSAKEYTISGLCQQCQDEVFEEEYDESRTY